jgi:hypothetical protein
VSTIILEPRVVAGFVLLGLVAACDAAEASNKKVEPPAPTPMRIHSDEPLGARLAREAEHRPHAALKTDAVFAALGTPGARTRQVLGETLGAAYCETSVADQGMVLAVCEFADAHAAEQGRERSHALFDELIKNRVLTVNGQTLLTVVSSGPDVHRAQQLSERFAAL